MAGSTHSYDISLGFLKQATQRVEKQRRLINADMSNLPFFDSSFDGILFSNVLEHVHPEDAVQAVKGGVIVLKPGGWIFINIPNREAWSEASWRNPRHVWLPNKREMVDLLGQNGFDTEKLIVTTRGFPGSNLFHRVAGRDLYSSITFYSCTPVGCVRFCLASMVKLSQNDEEKKTSHLCLC
ncbi:methyltransferase domain-containing protein [Candidatus Gottesmanbacteria bacterium]|nr:methyltransferase domain-containing protein [Candidatus Gottesmanbacteria bacterium]